jgi:hypothetical protein
MSCKLLSVEVWLMSDLGYGVWPSNFEIRETRRNGSALSRLRLDIALD